MKTITFVVAGVAVLGALYTLTRRSEGPQPTVGPQLALTRSASDSVWKRTDPKSLRSDYYEKAATVVAALQRCEQAHDKVTAGLRLGDRYNTYFIAVGARDECKTVGNAIDLIKLSDGYDPAIATRILSGIHTCALSLFARGEGLDKMATALDGDMRPSVVGGVAKDFADAETLADKCSTDMGSAARDGGIIDLAMPSKFIEPKPSPAPAETVINVAKPDKASEAKVSDAQATLNLNASDDDVKITSGH